MSADLETILGYQLAEFDAASRLRVGMFVSQLLVLSLIAGSVFTDTHILLFVIAIAAALLSAALLVLSYFYRQHRSVAERARRFTLIYGGLGGEIDPRELREIKSSFRVSQADAKAAFKKNYFATTSEPGRNRLGRMLEESSFWTSDLQLISAWIMFWVLVIVIILAVAATATVIPSVGNDQFVSAARVSLAILSFIFSSDFFGTMIGHFEFAEAARQVCDGVCRLSEKGYPETPLMVVLSDYNAAAEAGPLSIPLVYKLREKKLNELWQDYEKRRSCLADELTSLPD